MSWTAIAADWNRRRIVIDRPTPDLDPAHAFAVIRAVCAPFHRGMRHNALPSVGFEADGARIVGPGDLLPIDTDTDVAAYRARLASRATDWRLTVTEPLFVDYPLWSQVRDLLNPLWTEVGAPVCPVASELTVASGSITLGDTESSHAVLFLVLDGRAFAGDRELSAGDVLHLPAADPTVLRAAGHCLGLRLRVPVDRRLPTSEAVDLIGGLLAAEVAETGEPVPDVAFPARTDGGRLDADYPPDVRPHSPVRPDLRQEAERLTRMWWTGRLSAAGLDPAPAGQDVPELLPQQRIRLCAPVVDQPGPEPGQRLWAVNGMAFTVAGPVPPDVLNRLRASESSVVSELCRDADGDDNGAEPLLDRLHELRAVSIVEETS